MKTKTLFLLFFLVVFSSGIALAQNGVIKSYDIVAFHTDYLECTGDWLAGTLLAENLLANRNWITIIKKVDIKGYLDEACTIPSGNVYELSQTIPGLYVGESWTLESVAKLSLNGKVVAILLYNWHYQVNANGDVVAEFYKTSVHCK